jgi:hypothetical protein
MDWDKLRVFHAAAAAGSFTHAGEQLGLSPIGSEPAGLGPSRASCGCRCSTVTRAG